VLTLAYVDSDVLMPRSRRRRWLTFWAQLQSHKLDAQLAAGTAPESTDLLFAHARHIARPRSCAVLASSLRRIVVDPQRPRTRSNRVPVARDEVSSARREMVALADRLQRPGPIQARGVAQIRLLLGEGSGPIYRRDSGRNLLFELRDAAAHL
jgi:hypothetical protein